MGVDMSYLSKDSTHAAGGADVYPAVPDSNPWGVGGVPNRPTTPVGNKTEDGFYDQRDDLVGGTDTDYNLQVDSQQQSGANWYSAGDTAPVFNSASGLDGTGSPDGKVWSPTTRFTDTRSQDSLAGGENPATIYGH